MARKPQQQGFHEGTENDVTSMIDEAGRRAIEQATEYDMAAAAAGGLGPGEDKSALFPGNGAVVNDTTESNKQKKTPDEKRADFNRLASGRVSRAIDALSSLLHLANTSTYDWTDEAKDKIFSTLRDKIDTVEASFVAAKAPTDGKRKPAKQLSFRV